MLLLRITYSRSDVIRSQHLKQALKENLAVLHSFVGTGPNWQNRAGKLASSADVAAAKALKRDMAKALSTRNVSTIGKKGEKIVIPLQNKR